MVRRSGIAEWVYSLNEELATSLIQKYQIIFDIDVRTGFAKAICDNGTVCQINQMGDEQFTDSRNNDCEIPPEKCTLADYESCRNPKAECKTYFANK
jgi:hypothetical protein